MPKEEERIFIGQARVEKLSRYSPASDLVALANLYRDAWARVGINLTTNQAAVKVAAYDLSETFVVRDEQKVIRASIHTLPVRAAGFVDLVSQFATYRIVEQASASACVTGSNLPDQTTHRICFSITAQPDFCVGNKDSSISLAGFLLNGVFRQSGERLVAYSRFPEVSGYSLQDLLRHYLNNLQPGRSRNLGAVGMHEYFGAILGAIIPDSRPEDLKGGRANALGIYPDRNNEDEKKLFGEIKADRQRGIYRTRIHTITGAILFTDLPDGVL